MIRVSPSRRSSLAAAAAVLAACMFAAGCERAATPTTEAAPVAPVAAAAIAATPTPAAQPVAQPTAASPASAPAAGNDALAAQFRKGMAYGDFRRIVLAAGWKPVPTQACLANLLGDGAAQSCQANPALPQCRACQDIPELASCSSDALCLVNFRAPEGPARLQATGRGEVQYWSDTGDDAGLQLVDWQFSGNE